MKRLRFWLWLLLLPPLLQCCEKKYPNAETIIQGKIVDENDKPMEGVNFSFYGLQNPFKSSTFTFNLITKTNKNGEFTFSQVIPNGTVSADLSFSGFGLPYQGYILKDSKFVLYDPSLVFAYVTIGKTNNLKFQIKKI